MIQTLVATVEEKPEVVKCFVDGSVKGWYNYLYGDNAAANAMIKTDNPDNSDEQIAFSCCAAPMRRAPRRSAPISTAFRRRP